MNNRFFIGLTTDVQDGMFLLIGQEVGLNFTSVFLLPESQFGQVEWGDVVKLDLRGPKKKIGDDFMPCATLIEKEPRSINRGQAVDLQDAINDFLQEKGWTEEKEGNLEEAFKMWEAHFGVFPD
jgi:hypothetical protein